jgi:hypothetical protein
MREQPQQHYPQWHNGDDQRGQAAGNVAFAERDESVAAQQQGRADEGRAGQFRPAEAQDPPRP